MTKQKIAVKYGTTQRTIDRWKAAGAPLESEEKMVVWLAGRKNIPPKTAAWLSSRQREARVSNHGDSVLTANGLPKGATSALVRLEEAEAIAYTDLQGALRRGDASEIKTRRESWLKIGDSLRRYDLLLQNSGRAETEMISRKVMDKALFLFVFSIRKGLQQMAASISALLPNQMEVELALTRASMSALIAASASSISFYGDDIPEWVAESLSSDAAAWFRPDPQRLKLLGEIIAAYVDNQLSAELMRGLSGPMLETCIAAAQKRVEEMKAAK